jgi:hypothetical protein
MALIIRAVRAKKAPNLGLQRGFSLSGTLQERLFTGSRVLNEVVLEGEFCELRIDGVLRSSALGHSEKSAYGCVLGPVDVVARDDRCVRECVPSDDFPNQG